jgi:hypothetical protein
MENFHLVLYLNIFRKSVDKVQFSLNNDNHDGYFIVTTLHISFRSHSVLLELEKFLTKIVEEFDTFIFIYFIFFSKILLYAT